MTPWIAVDLDGTLAKYESGDGIESIGEPIAPMVERVKAWLAEGKDVRIMTARVSSRGHTGLEVARQCFMIRAWCRTHIGQGLPLTSEKDYGMVELWDDRAVGVERNVGERCDEIAREVGRMTATGHIRLYDKRYGIESDAYADYQPEQYAEHSGKNLNVIGVGAFTGAEQFYVTPREARVLAAHLLREADVAEADLKAKGLLP